MLPIQPLLELGTLLLTYYYVVIIAAGESHDELGTEEETDLADAADGIEHISDDSASSPTGIYSVSGVRLNKLQKGINIVNGNIA